MGLRKSYQFLESRPKASVAEEEGLAPADPALPTAEGLPLVVGHEPPVPFATALGENGYCLASEMSPPEKGPLHELIAV